MRAPQAVMVGMGGGGLHIERGVARGPQDARPCLRTAGAPRMAVCAAEITTANIRKQHDTVHRMRNNLLQLRRGALRADRNDK